MYDELLHFAQHRRTGFRLTDRSPDGYGLAEIEAARNLEVLARPLGWTDAERSFIASQRAWWEEQPRTGRRRIDESHGALRGVRVSRRGFVDYTPDVRTMDLAQYEGAAPSPAVAHHPATPQPVAVIPAAAGRDDSRGAPPRARQPLTARQALTIFAVGGAAIIVTFLRNHVPREHRGAIVTAAPGRTSGIWPIRRR